MGFHRKYSSCTLPPAGVRLAMAQLARGTHPRAIAGLLIAGYHEDNLRCHAGAGPALRCDEALRRIGR